MSVIVRETSVRKYAFTSLCMASFIAAAGCARGCAPKDSNASHSKLSVGMSHTCKMDNTRQVLCWGTDEFGESKVPDELDNVVSIYAGVSHTCALDRRGSVTCWDDDEYGQSTPPTSLQNIVQISSGAAHSCALNHMDEITCWGDHTNRQSNPPQSLRNTSAIGAGGVLHLRTRHRGSDKLLGNECARTHTHPPVPTKVFLQA